MAVPKTLGIIGRVAGAAWLAVGVLVLIVLLLEGLYRSQAAARHAVSDWRAQGAARDSSVVARQRALYATEEPHIPTPVWKPYVYYRRPQYRGGLVNIDRLGHRNTIQPHAVTGATRDVYIFGASPLWGTGLGDSLTIPSLVASGLNERAVHDVKVTNFGETGYVFTQELLELMLQLRAGHRPSVVVFYDSYNDIAAGIAGRSGETKGEDWRARDYGVGEKLFSWGNDVGTDIRASRELLSIGARRLQLINRLRRTDAHDTPLSNDSVAGLVVSNYLATAEIVDALSKHYGFVPFYVWMPILDSTMKPLSPFEKRVDSSIQAGTLDDRIRQVHRLTRKRFAVVAAGMTPGHYSDLGDVLRADTGTVFVDELGHTSASGAALVAGEIARLIAPALTQK